MAKEMKTSIVLGGKVADSLKSAFKFTEKNMKSIAVANKIAAGTTNVMGKAVSFAAKTIAIGTAAATAGLIALGNETIKTADKIGKMHAQTNLSMAELQRLEYMSTQLNFSFDSIGTAVSYLTRNMGSAASGSKDLIDTFGKMGIAFEAEGKLRNQADVFKEAIFFLSQMEDEAERNVIAFKLFGRGAAELFPLFEAGAAEMARLAEEADKLGMVMSDEDIIAFDKLGDTIDTLTGALKGMGRQILASKLPNMQAFLDKVVMDLPKIEASVKNGLTLLSKFGSTIFNIISFVGRNWNKIEPVLVFLGAFFLAITLITKGMILYAAATTAAGAAMAFLNSPIFLTALAIAAVITVLYLLYKNWDKVSNFLVEKWETYVMPYFNAVADFFEKLFGGISSGVEKVADFFEKLFGGISSGVEKVTGFFATSKTVDIAARVESMPRFARGGFADRPSVFGEAGPEAAIPLKPGNRRSLGLLNKTAQALGAGGQGVVIHYSPVINGSNRAEIQTALEEDKPRFRDYVQSALAEQRRVAFDG